MIQGLGAKFVGNLLGVREPETNGILIVGSNPIALLVATSLKEQGFDVIVAHNNYTNIAKARMSGLRTYFGNPISDHADHHLDLIGIGRLFAMSMDKEMNTLSEIHYRHEFGERKLYRLKFSEEKVKSERDDKQSNFSSQWLFGKDVTYTKLASMLSKKAKIKITNITDSYTYEQYKADNKQFVPLYTIDKEGKLHVITDKFDGSVPRDRKLIALVVDDGIKPKPVDVTAKQEQARAAADADFEARYKAPEKRKEKELVADGTADTEAQAADKEASTAGKEDSADNAGTKTASDTENNSFQVHESKAAKAGNTPNKITAADKTTAKLATPAVETAVDKGVKSNNAKATTKTDTGTNVSGEAPKTKSGSLDPNRLPGSTDSNSSANNSPAKNSTAKNSPAKNSPAK
jgi:hypothetical protein